MTIYPWYTTITGNTPLEQGDFIKQCPVIIPTSKVTMGNLSATAQIYDVVIVSQSCDLENGKLKLVLVCPFEPLSKMEQKNEVLRSKGMKEKLRQGNLPNFHLLNKCNLPGFEYDYLVVSFRDIFSIPFDYIVNVANTDSLRLRLLSPYKEHLSQAFARFFMRVGLPEDIPPFK